VFSGEEERVDWVKIPSGSLCRESSGIVHLRIDPDTRLNAEEASDLVAALDAYIPTPAPFLADITGIAWVDRGARDQIASAHYAKARAILVRDAASKVIAQLFENLHNPEVETHTFTDENAAREWLETFID
jgi:hypothetical protein